MTRIYRQAVEHCRTCPNCQVRKGTRACTSTGWIITLERWEQDTMPSWCPLPKKGD